MNGRAILEGLFKQFQLRNLDEWKQVPKTYLLHNGAKKLLSEYNNDIQKLLLSLYPEHDWKFSSIESDNQSTNTKKTISIFTQRKDMEELFRKFRFESLESWYTLAPYKITHTPKLNALINIYSKNLELLLKTLYPNYPWRFEEKGRDAQKNPLRSFNIYEYEQQREMMEYLFKLLNLTHLLDWTFCSQSKFQKIGGKAILRLYEGDFKQLLITIYPNYPWSFIQHLTLTTIYPNYCWQIEDRSSKPRLQNFRTIEAQRQFLNGIVQKLKLRRLEELKMIRKGTMKEQGAQSLLSNYYDNDMRKLLCSVYPNYPWRFEDGEDGRLDRKFESIDQQREFMNALSLKLKITSLDDWLLISTEVIKMNGGKSLLRKYSQSKKNILRSIYANYPWSFKARKEEGVIRKSMLKDIEQQRSFMDQLFQRLELNTLEDWKYTSPTKLIKHGGKALLYLYQHDFKELLETIYPLYDWSDMKSYAEKTALLSSSPLSFTHHFKAMVNQRSYLNFLFMKFRLTLLSDWLIVSKARLKKFKRASSLLYLYSNQLTRMITTVYPNYPWRSFLKSTNYHQTITNNNIDNVNNNDDDEYRIRFKSPSIYFQRIENQRQFMNDAFNNLKLQTLHDFLNLPRSTYMQLKGGARTLLNRIYIGNYRRLLSTIYPNYPWPHLQHLKYDHHHHHHSHSHHLQKQRQYMERLYYKLKLTSLEGWLQVAKYKFKQNGGAALLSLYHDDLHLALTTIYPNYCWQIDHRSSTQQRMIPNYRSIEAQRRVMNTIYENQQLRTFDDWRYMTRKRMMMTSGGRRLLRIYYNDDMMSLLTTIYPNYPFTADVINDDVEGGKRNDDRVIQRRIRRKIKQYRLRYAIMRKQDWYRVGGNVDSLSFLLNSRYRKERWEIQRLRSKNKKSAQRILYSMLTQRVFPSQHIYENYKHPILFTISNPLEYDIFLPAFDLAIEYQGEQHFDHIPSYFSDNLNYRMIDDKKCLLSIRQSITLIHIPYWWNYSILSLYQSIAKSKLFSTKSSSSSSLPS